MNSSSNVFRETDKQALEPKPANIDKMMEIAENLDRQREAIQETADKLKESEIVKDAWVGNGMNPYLEVLTMDGKSETNYLLANEIVEKSKISDMVITNSESVDYSPKETGGTFKSYFELKPEVLKEICEISEKYGENFSVISERDGAKFEVSGKDVDMKPLKDDLKVLPQKFKDAVKGKLSENGKTLFENGKRSDQEKQNDNSRKPALQVR